jgi:hypothetical protein
MRRTSLFKFIAKRSVILLITLIGAGAVVWVLAANLSSWRGAGTTEDSELSMAVAREQEQGMEDLPVDPNAYELNLEREYVGQWKSMKYKSTTPGPDLATFYKSQMASKGWELEWASNQSNSEIDTRFTWLDPSGFLPFDLICQVDIEDTRFAYSANRGPAYVNLSLNRVPKVSKVPLYPGATQVQTRDPGTQHTITTFLTNDTIAQVEEYYSATLPEYGWSGPSPALDPMGDKPIPNSLAFGSYAGGSGATITIMMEDTKEGTIVGLRPSGNTYFGR